MYRVHKFVGNGLALLSGTYYQTQQEALKKVRTHHNETHVLTVIENCAFPNWKRGKWKTVEEVYGTALERFMANQRFSSTSEWEVGKAHFAREVF